MICLLIIPLITIEAIRAFRNTEGDMELFSNNEFNFIKIENKG